MSETGTSGRERWEPSETDRLLVRDPCLWWWLDGRTG